MENEVVEEEDITEEESDVAYLVQVNPLVGRCLVAKRDLQQGELILRELPLVHGPSKDSDLICLGCYASLDVEEEEDDDDDHGCDLCGLPVCADGKEVCQLASRHRPECEAVQRAGRSKALPLLEDSPLLHEVVLVVRCLDLRQARPDDFRELLRLESHLEARGHDPDLRRRVDKVCAFVTRDLALDVDVATVERLCGVLDVNSFEVPGGTVQAVYRTICLLEHHCIPNTHRCFHPDDDLSLDVRAATAVPAGGHLATTYTDSLWPTAERRAHLLASKHFECTCARCADPTEAGTHLSTVLCSKCPGVGNLLSDDPLEPDADWTCDACGNVTPVRYVRAVNEQVALTVALMEENDGGLNPDQCERFLAIHARILHPCHAHMLDVRHTLLHLLGHCQGHLMADLSDRQLQVKEEAARTLADVADMLLPGVSRLKGTTLYELFLVYQQRAVNWKTSAARGVGDVVGALRTAKDCLEESLDLLQYEPADNAEGRLLARAREERNALVDFMATL